MRGTRAKRERKLGLRAGNPPRGKRDVIHVPIPFDHAAERRSHATRWPTADAHPSSAHAKSPLRAFFKGLGV